MSFNFGHGKIDLNIKTYGSNTNNNAIDAFKNSVYDDVIDFNIITYDNDVTYNGEFSFYEGAFDFDVAYANACAHVSDIEATKLVLDTLWDFGCDAVEGVFSNTAVASVCMLFFAAAEGIVGAVELFFDGAVSLVGFVSGGIIDVVGGVFTGDWSFSATNAIIANLVIPIVAYDATGNLFSFVDDSTMNNAACCWCKRGGFLYNVTKEISKKATQIFMMGSSATSFLGTAFNSFSGDIQVRFSKLNSEDDLISNKEIFNTFALAGGKGLIEGSFRILGDKVVSFLYKFDKLKPVVSIHKETIKAFVGAFKESASRLVDTFEGILNGDGFKYNSDGLLTDFISSFLVESLYSNFVKEVKNIETGKQEKAGFIKWISNKFNYYNSSVFNWIKNNNQSEAMAQWSNYDSKDNVFLDYLENTIDNLFEKGLDGALSSFKKTGIKFVNNVLSFIFSNDESDGR